MTERVNKLDCESWQVSVDTFTFKAQQNLIFAEFAKKQGRFDIEANRIYYALHQLACELVLQGIMELKYLGRNATVEEPWRLDHRSYNTEIEKTLGIRKAGRILSKWYKFREIADYTPEQVSKEENWKQTAGKLRKDAHKIAEAIYEQLPKKYNKNY